MQQATAGGPFIPSRPAAASKLQPGRQPTRGAAPTLLPLSGAAGIRAIQSRRHINSGPWQHGQCNSQWLLLPCMQAVPKTARPQLPQRRVFSRRVLSSPHRTGETSQLACVPHAFRTTTAADKTVEPINNSTHVCTGPSCYHLHAQTSTKHNACMLCTTPQPDT